MQEQLYNAFKKDIENIEFTDIKELSKKYTAFGELSEKEKMVFNNYMEDWFIKFAYNTNAIEGSTMTLKDTMLYFQGYLPNNRDINTKKDVLALQGTIDGYYYIQKLLKKDVAIDKEIIKNIHEKIALEIPPSRKGIFRTESVYISEEKTIPVNYKLINESIDDLIYQYNNSKGDVVAKICAFHTMFERIHPFQDGNGRTARMIMNYQLMQNNLPPITIKNDAKREYYIGLEEWACENKPNRLIEIVHSSLKKELETKIEFMTESREYRTEFSNSKKSIKY